MRCSAVQCGVVRCLYGSRVPYKSCRVPDTRRSSPTSGLRVVQEAGE